MSAHTEGLLEKIQHLERTLAEGRLGSVETVAATEELAELRRQLSSSAEALNEGKSLLKG